MPLKPKETNITTKHKRLKNPNWWKADQLAIYKHDRGVELRSTEKTEDTLLMNERLNRLWMGNRQTFLFIGYIQEAPRSKSQ